MWRRNWTGIIPFMAYPDFIRKIIYTTNAIESLNHSLRKMTKTKGAFPTDEAARKSLYLCLQNVKKKWTMPIRERGQALNQFAIISDGRFILEQE
jgi:putative transposase